MSETRTEPIEITQRAAQKAIALARREGHAEAFLRLRVTAGGCSGFSYKLSFEDGPQPEDHVVEAFGLRLLVDPKSTPIVAGAPPQVQDALPGGGVKGNKPPG